MRSLLFVPAHDTRKLTKALDSGADALILDLEDAVPEAEKARARQACAEFVAQHWDRMPLIVRVNALDSRWLLEDLAAIVKSQPHGVMLPKCTSGRDVAQVGAYLSALETREGIPVGSTYIFPIVTESASALFDMGSYAREAGPRLAGMLWGGEDLAADIGATANREGGQYTPPFQLARSLCLFAAAAAGVPAIDAVYTDFRDAEGLTDESRAAVAAGFSGKAAIHPAQIAPINTAFTPDADAVRAATAISEAFARQPDAGAINLDGRMLDRPHLKAAQRVLVRAAQAGVHHDSKSNISGGAHV